MKSFTASLETYKPVSEMQVREAYNYILSDKYHIKRPASSQNKQALLLSYVLLINQYFLSADPARCIFYTDQINSRGDAAYIY